MTALKFVEFDPDRYTALLTLEESTNPRIKIGLQGAIREWDVDYNDLLDQFTVLNMNYGGRFYNPKSGFVDPLTGKFKEAYVNTKALEEAPYEWWRDTFGRVPAQVGVVRVRVEAIQRWRAIGSIFRAWYPAEFHGFTHDAANDDIAPQGLT